MRRALGHAAGLERANRLAAALFAVFATAAVLTKAIGGPTWTSLAFALVGVIGALVAFVLVLWHQRALDHEQRKALTLGPAVILREAANAKRFYDLGVETEANEALALLGGSSHADYLPRDVDVHLVHRLEQAATRERPSLVVVSGPAKAGKSRTALEAAAAALPDAWLICPASAEALVELARTGCPSTVGKGQACVLWLDDIERFARPGGRGLGPDTLEVLHCWGRPVVVLATHGGKGLALAGPEGARFLETTTDLLRRYPPVRLAPRLSDDESVRLRELYGEAAATPIERSGVGEFMIAAPRLIDRLENERDCPEGRAIALAAIDCQRAGLVRALPVAWLEDLYASYLPGPPASERFQRGLEWATRPLYSRVALLGRGDGDPPGYHPYDYLVAHVDERRGDPINHLLLDKVVDEYADREQELLLAGAAADRRGDIERAVRAWLRADERGSFHGALNLAFLLERQGDLSAAEAAYARADERGFADVEGHLGLSASVAIERHGYIAQEDSFRRADEQGDADAAVRLGLLLSRRGDATAAEAAFLRADERGSANGAFNLAVLMMRRGDLEGAQAAHRRAEQRDTAIAAPSQGNGAGP